MCRGRPGGVRFFERKRPTAQGRDLSPLAIPPPDTPSGLAAIDGWQVSWLAGHSTVRLPVLAQVGWPGGDGGYSPLTVAGAAPDWEEASAPVSLFSRLMAGHHPRARIARARQRHKRWTRASGASDLSRCR